MVKQTKKEEQKTGKSAELKNVPKTHSFMDEVVKKHEQLKSTGAGGNFFSLKNGDNEVRLLLFTDEETKKEHLFSSYRSHFINKVKKSFVCLGGIKACPICRYIGNLETAHGQTEFTKNARAKEKFYINALDTDGNLVLLDIGSQAMEGITAIFANKKYGNIADLKSGRKVTITKTGSGLDTTYTVLPDPDIDPVKLREKPKDLNALAIAKRPSEQELISFVESTFDVDYSELKDDLKDVDKDDLPF